MANKYRAKSYIGAWKYVFLDILYVIPIIGWIFLIVHALGASHENVKHYARSYFARLLLAVIVVVAIAAVIFLIAGEAGLLDAIDEMTTAVESYR